MKRMYLAVAVSLLLGNSAPAHATPAQAIKAAGILETGCPLSDPSTVVAADGTKSEIKFTVTCNLAGQKLVTFEFKFDTSGTECTEPTLSHTSGTGAASRKVNIGATCKLDQTGRGGYDVKRTTTIDIAGLVMQTESTQRTEFTGTSGATMRHTSDTDISASTELLPLQEADSVIKAGNVNFSKQTCTPELPGGDPEGSVEVENTSEDDVEAGGDAAGGYSNTTRLSSACPQLGGSAASKTKGGVQTS